MALGLLLNRAPLYAGPAAVLPPVHVGAAYEALQSLDWAAPELVEIQTLFLRAARVVNDTALDVPKSLREKIASRLESAGVAPLKLEKLRAFVPMKGADQAGLFGNRSRPDSSSGAIECLFSRARVASLRHGSLPASRF